MSDDPPPGWSVARLQDALQPGGLFDGPFGSNLKTSDYTDSGVRVVRLENLANLRFIEEKRTYISPAKYKSLTRHSVSEGDVLFGSFLDDAVRVCLMPRLPVPAIAKADCFCIRPRQDMVDPRFLMYQLGRSATRDALIEEIHGVTRPRVTTKQLRQLEILVPPLSEQKQIVETIDALLAKMTDARERLTRVSEILKRFRQSVLAAACSGRLTDEWRAAHRDAPDNGGNQPDVTTDGLPPAFTHRPEEDLPEGWRFLSLGSLGEWRSGATPSKGKAQYWSNGTLPWVSPKDMKSSLIGSSQDLVTEAAVRETRLPAVPAGTLLFVVRGMILAHTFPVGLTTRPVTFNQDIRALTPSAGIEPRFLLLALQHEARHILFAVKEATHGTLRLDADTLQPWPVPLPPWNEQHEIVRRVEALFALAADIQDQVAAACGLLDKLPAAVLATAFRGRLTGTPAPVT